MLITVYFSLSVSFFLSLYVLVMFLFLCDTCDICLDLWSSCLSECNAMQFSCFKFFRVRKNKCVNKYNKEYILCFLIRVNHIFMY